MQAAGGNLLVLLTLVVATLVLGLALPTTAAYLIAATIAPALETVGVPRLAAHLFMLLQDSPASIGLHVGTAAVGVVFLSSAVTGFLSGPLPPWTRLGLAAGAALLFHPSAAASAAGLAVCGTISAARMLRRPRPLPAPSPGHPF